MTTKYTACFFTRFYKILILLVILATTQFAYARTIRIYFSIKVQTDPENAELSIKTGPLLDWEYIGKAPRSMILFRDLNTKDFVKERTRYGGQTAYYSDRYGYNTMYASPDELFDQLKRNYGDKIIQDFGMVATGGLMAESDGYEKEFRTITLNGNIQNISFDQSVAEGNPNTILIPLKERDCYHNHY
jgi:hypothetical protein